MFQGFMYKGGTTVLLHLRLCISLANEQVEQLKRD